MTRKRPSSIYASSPDGELKFMQKYAADEAITSKLRVAPTRGSKKRANDYVGDFVRSGKIAGYPRITSDENEEEAFAYGPGAPSVVLEPLVADAMKKSARPSPVEPRTISSTLLRSFDQEHGCDVQHLPARALGTDRILAHLSSLPFRLEPRVAIAIARRAMRVLLNVAAPGSSVAPAAPPPPGSVEEPEAQARGEEHEEPACEPELQGSSEAEPEEDFCVECGASYPRGAAHRCSEPAAIPLAPLQEPVEQHAACAADVQTAPAPPDPEPNGEDLLRAFRRQLCFVMEIHQGQLVRAAASPSSKSVEPRNGAPAPAPRPHQREPRRVVTWARVLVDLRFFFEEGIGKPGHFDYLKAGSVVEVLEPSERDKHDQEVQKARDLVDKKPPRNLVVVRWWGGVSLVFGYELERTGLEEYKKYLQTEEAHSHDQARADGARRGVGTDEALGRQESGGG